MNVPLAVSFLYLMLGMGVTTTAWVAMPDELELALSVDVDDESERPVLQFLLTLFFVLGWPVVLHELIKER